MFCLQPNVGAPRFQLTPEANVKELSQSHRIDNSDPGKGAALSFCSSVCFRTCVFIACNAFLGYIFSEEMSCSFQGHTKNRTWACSWDAGVFRPPVSSLPHSAVFRGAYRVALWHGYLCMCVCVCVHLSTSRNIILTPSCHAH